MNPTLIFDVLPEVSLHRLKLTVTVTAVEPQAPHSNIFYVMVHICSLSTQEADVGGLPRVHSQPRLQID